MKKWVQIFKILGNFSRLKIIKLLKGYSGGLSVSEIAKEIGISLKGASQHLVILDRAGVLRGEGKQGRVYYSLSPEIPKDFQKAINLFL